MINIDPIFLEFLVLKISWYGVLFAIGFGISRFIIKHIFTQEGRWQPKSDWLLLYMISGTLVGARLGHVLFYDPKYYFSNPEEILQIWEGGLASHGAAVGIIIAVAAYCYHWNFDKASFVKTDREGYSYLQIIDRMAIVVALGACFIRVGNFINAEALGQVTQSPLGVHHTLPVIREIKKHLGSIEKIELQKNQKNQFSYELHFPDRIKDIQIIHRYREQVVDPLLSRIISSKGSTLSELISSRVTRINSHYLIAAELVPIYRHPAQLYEATGYLLLFLYLFYFWVKKRLVTPPGLIFGIFLMGLFGVRILVEFFKIESSVLMDTAFNMGQILSIPFFILGLIFLFRNKAFFQ